MPFKKDTELTRTAGQRGGLKTKKRLADDPDYFRRIGKIGGEIMRKRGPEYYRAIAKMQRREEADL